MRIRIWIRRRENIGCHHFSNIRIRERKIEIELFEINKNVYRCRGEGVLERGGRAAGRRRAHRGEEQPALPPQNQPQACSQT